VLSRGQRQYSRSTLHYDSALLFRLKMNDCLRGSFAVAFTVDKFRLKMNDCLRGSFAVAFTVDKMLLVCKCWHLLRPDYKKNGRKRGNGPFAFGVLFSS
jgi:hypothetical protein